MTRLRSDILFLFTSQKVAVVGSRRDVMAIALLASL